MRYASICDGIGAVHAAWKPLGWDCAWTAEIEPYPAAVVEHHHHLPNLGDITKITEADIERHGPIDLLVGGTPCQSFSLAGLRGGLADPRGNLALRFLQLAAATRARWVVWENVPGVLSSWSDAEAGTDGSRWQTNDFETFTGGLGELGYGYAYRILDAQYFGVPQRRRRVFVVGYLGDWRRAAAVLFERQSLRGDSPPERQKGERIAGTITRSALDGSGACGGDGREGMLLAINAADGQTRGAGINPATLVTGTLTAGSGQDLNHGHSHLLAFGGNNTSGPTAVATAVNACKTASGRQDFESETFITHALTGVVPDASEDGTGRGTPIIAIQDTRQETGGAGFQEEVGFTMENRHTPQAIAYQTRIGRYGRGQPKGIVDALTSCASGTHADSKPHVAGSFGVRRITPLEAERLQGFPDHYTAITYKGRPAADSPRYCALGNSMALPVVRWLGRRIDAVSTIPESR